MLFQDLRVQDIQTVFRFSARTKSFTAQKRRSHIIGIMLSGRALHRFDDRAQVLEQGQIYFFNQNDRYSVEILESDLAFSVHFTTMAPISQKSFFASVADPSGVIRCMERLERSFLSGGSCADSLSELYRLIALFAALAQPPHTAQNQRMAEAKAYMNLHFKEKDCIAAAARVYGVTPRRFTDLFSQSCHTTPNRYLLQVKLEKAKQLLLAEELSLAQVAELSGFSDVYYFSKVFRQETGETPGAYRKQQG